MPSEFQWIEINFAPLRPTGFGYFHRAGQSLLFAGRASLISAINVISLFDHTVKGRLEVCPLVTRRTRYLNSPNVIQVHKVEVYKKNQDDVNYITSHLSPQGGRVCEVLVPGVP